MLQGSRGECYIQRQDNRLSKILGPDYSAFVFVLVFYVGEIFVFEFVVGVVLSIYYEDYVSERFQRMISMDDVVSILINSELLGNVDKD
ncbi:MAG: hypothetical protein EZS28_012933 [Streblomastix strix]|uniref:Ion transport domain-containing protein n=1 Tax=Streblomastix strix TaxID=222440 RepID=A0A5J4W9J6_9EUKA|nr:MAG: hypothetical protein EZS28_012933 [Streblomastix strix]